MLLDELTGKNSSFLMSSRYCLHCLQKTCVGVLRVGLVYLDIQARLQTLGITIMQETSATFEIRNSGKLRIQSASLTVRVCSDQKLIDLLQGKVLLEGILGPATIALLDDDSDTVHQMELKPNKHIDRRGLSLLTNIWATLGASETQTLSWILLCTSSQLGQIWAAESATLANPDGPAHLPTI